VNDIPKTTEHKGNGGFHRLISKTPKRDEESLKEHNEEAFEKQVIEEAKLLDAFANKKLKSKAAIKRARALAKKKSDAGKKNDKAANPQVNPTVEGQ
jgi:hypothetical protein